jgi:tRNA pseudouridine38-40 synthase
VVVGEHDFTSFAAVDPERVERMAAGENVQTTTDRTSNVSPTNDRPTNVRTIFASSWTREGEELIYTVRGNGFLHHMVRNLVGTFLLVGKETVSLEDLRGILEARERTAAGATAPASGLYLVDVEY